MKKLLNTTDDILPLILRIGLGIVILPHGLQKILGVFGGHGPAWTVEKWHLWWGIPAPITWLVILGESIGIVLLILGLGTRLVSASLAIIMMGAVYLVHWNHGFFMNWYSEPNRGEGLEYHILVFTIIIALIIRGGGKWSFDGVITNQIASK